MKLLAQLSKFKVGILAAAIIAVIIISVNMKLYHQHERRKQMTKIVALTLPIRKEIVLCFYWTGSFEQCDNSYPKIGKTFHIDKRLVDSMTINKGIVTVVPKAKGGLSKKDVLILEPTYDKATAFFSWKTLGPGSKYLAS